VLVYLTGTEGSNNRTIYCNDTSGNTNFTVHYFTIDLTYPLITIETPTNLSNLSSETFELNYTFIETNIDSCWYSNNSGISNSSIVVMGINWTTLNGTEGSNNRTIYCNDSANNINSSSVVFTIDTIYPNINISFPLNHTNTSNVTLNVNYTTSETSTDIDACWYSNDTYATNTTLASCVNITTLTWTEGMHNVTIWTNDSANNINHSFIYFTIDTINPDINITYPINNTNYANPSLDVLYTRSDVNLESCWYSNDSYAVNTTLASCINITTITWTIDTHNVTIWANDSANNINHSFVNFSVTAAPEEVGGRGASQAPSYAGDEEFEIELDMHYYKNGYEIKHFYIINFSYDAISLDIIGTNNRTYNYTNVHPLNISPDEFWSHTITNRQTLEANETKILWNSSVINIDKFKEENITFYVKVIGLGRGLLRGEDSLNLTIGKYIEGDKPFFMDFGEKIYPSNPLFGVIIGGFLFFLGLVILWRYDNVVIWAEKKTIGWKQKGIKKRRENKGEIEGW